MFNLKFKIIDLECAACVRLCTQVLQNISGVKKVIISMENGEANLTADREIAWPEIVTALKSEGKQAQALNNY